MLCRWPWEQCSYHHNIAKEKELSLGIGKKLLGHPRISQRAAISQPEINLPETTGKNSINLKVMEKKNPKIFLSGRKEIE